MEFLLLCAIAFVAGRQSEQASLGISPADRAMAKEHRRHERRVREIAEKHGTPPPAPAPFPASPWKEPPAATTPATVPAPDTFRSGYRSYVPAPRTSTWTGRRVGTAGAWTARGVAWAKDTGKAAVREYRERRTADGHDDPAPVLVPLPPTHPPAVPPIPKDAPTVHEKPETPAGPGPPKSEAPAADETPEPAPVKEAAEEPATGPEEASEPESTKEAETAPETAAEEPATVPEPRKPEDDAETEAEKAPETAPESAAEEETTPATPDSAPDSGTAPTGNGVGRMAAEVTYESVMDESDELSLMCDEDVQVYGRIGIRCEREIGRADVLIADCRNVGVGESVIGWISRALEKYQGIHASLDELTANTVAQGEAVVKAKALLEAGQGVYADIAKDMEDVADREFYVSDAVDGEDTAAHTETYETRGA